MMRPVLVCMVLTFAVLAGCAAPNDQVTEVMDAQDAIALAANDGYDTHALVALGTNYSIVNTSRDLYESFPQDDDPFDGLAPAWLLWGKFPNGTMSALQVFPSRIVHLPGIAMQGANAPTDGWPSPIGSSAEAMAATLIGIQDLSSGWATAHTHLNGHVEGSGNALSGLAFTTEPRWTFTLIPEEGIIYEAYADGVTGRFLGAEPVRHRTILMDKAFSHTDPVGELNVTREYLFDIPPLSKDLVISIAPIVTDPTSGASPYRFELQAPDGSNPTPLPTQQIPMAEYWQVQEPMAGTWTLTETHVPNPAVPVRYRIYAAADLPVVTQHS